jgi:hypothetical protein
MAMVATSMVSTGEAVWGKAGLGSKRDAERGDRGAFWRDHTSRSGHVHADQQMGAHRREKKEGGRRVASTANHWVMEAVRGRVYRREGACAGQKSQGVGEEKEHRIHGKIRIGLPSLLQTDMAKVATVAVLLVVQDGERV